MQRGLPFTKTIKRSDVVVVRSQCPGLVLTDSIGAQAVFPASGTNGTNGSNYPFFGRIRIPFNMRVYAIGLPLNVVLAGTAPVVRFNLGLFTANEDSEYGEPMDQLEPTSFCQVSLASGMTGSSRQISAAALSKPTKTIRSQTPLFCGGLWSVISGTIAASTQGGVHTYAAFDPAFAQGVNSAHRAGLRGSEVRAYSAASMEGLPLAIKNGSAFPTNWTAVTSSGGTDASNFANIDYILYGDEMY